MAFNAIETKYLFDLYKQFREKANINLCSQNITYDQNWQKELEIMIKQSFSFSNRVPYQHQWQTILEIIQDIFRPLSLVSTGRSKNYLIQHSAGSGKSLTIACLIFFLYHLRMDSNNHIFDTIIVLNDRKVLDVQLGRTIDFFFRCTTIRDIVKIDNSEELKKAIENKTGVNRVILSTIQMFKRVSPDQKTFCSNTKKIAIIADEAHRSHGKRTTNYMHMFLDKKVHQSSNINYFSFTSTPTKSALEMFGTLKHYDHSTHYEPFFTYSINQCIKDRIILNPLLNYYCVSLDSTIIQPIKLNLVPSVSYPINDLVESRAVDDDEDFDDEEFNRNKSYSKNFYKDARRFSPVDLIQKEEFDIAVIKKKSRYIVDHLRKIIKEVSTVNFSPKAMLIVRSRANILIYKEYIEMEIAKLPSDEKFYVLCSFTQFESNGRIISEEDRSINPFFNGSIESVFRCSASMKLLICADKFQTGFDEPLLHTMYIDKSLCGANAVQTISRVNRIARDKTTTCIVDFSNDFENIKKAFEKYSGKTYCLATSRNVSSEIINQIKILQDKISNFRFMNEPDLTKCAIYIFIMDSFVKSFHVTWEMDQEVKEIYDTIQNKYYFEEKLNEYLSVMDRVKVEELSQDLSLSKVMDLKQKLIGYHKSICQTNKIYKEIETYIEKIIQTPTYIVQVIEMWDQIFTPMIDSTKNINEIIQRSCSIFQERVRRELKINFEKTISPICSDETIDFAKSIWKPQKRTFSTFQQSKIEAEKPIKQPRREATEKERAIIKAVAKEIASKGKEYEFGVMSLSKDPQFSYLDKNDPLHHEYLIQLDNFKRNIIVDRSKNIN